MPPSLWTPEELERALYKLILVIDPNTYDRWKSSPRYHIRSEMTKVIDYVETILLFSLQGKVGTVADWSKQDQDS